MEEFKLNINAYSPEYGRSNGGTVMVIGKSGSNQFHGDLFEFFRNEALNAQEPVRATRTESGIPPQSVRRDRGRTDSDQQDILLRGLAGNAAANRHHAIQRGSDARATAGHLHPADLRSRHSNPRTPFVNNTIPTTRFDAIGAAGSAALSASERHRREQFCSNRDRARQSGSGRLPRGPLLRGKAPGFRTLHLSSATTTTPVDALAGRKRKSHHPG